MAGNVTEKIKGKIMNKEVDRGKIREIISKYDGEKSAAVAVLQDLQEEFRYLPKEALTIVSDELQVPLSRIYEIATFYNVFSLKPRGKYLIEVCAGTACHVQGGFNLMNRLERNLNISCGETTEDAMFTLEEVRCLGCCSLAPVVRIDGNIHPYLTQDEIPGILKNYRKAGVKK
ncbi:NADH:ubiquinone oxidoreductase 24 kD subunit NuoE [Syntrophus aciditrophicus SB]|uniref:NADH:ubiquinone oxidoreductase 24 kD subunit NuoE n=2 Tax=Syntrophus TaxID=43773 RepID=Q2LYE8_SYNAS|nr:NADH:ubiquinone oxidoreductase 24 kD subunit NuoE [Syntrophus aciditrophicus SB]